MVGLEPERWRPASIFHLQGAEPQRLFTWSLHLDWLGHSHSIEGAGAVKQLHGAEASRFPATQTEGA